MSKGLTEQLKEVDSTLPPYPKRPSKPQLKGSSSSEAKIYAEKLEEYENLLNEYSIAMKAYNDADHEANGLRKKIVCDYYGLDTVPEKYQDKIWKFAWDQGHSGGWTEVGYYLDKLLDIFLD